MHASVSPRPRRYRRILGWVLGILAGIYLAIMLGVVLMEEKLVLSPSSQMFTTPQAKGMAYEEAQLTTTDGAKIYGWFVPAEKPRGTVLYLHGNGGNISTRMNMFRTLRDLGLNTFMIDYRGFGKSTGRISEQGTYADAEAAWRYLTEDRHIAASQIIVLGESFGGGPAAWTAVTHTPGALVLFSTFARFPDLEAEVLPWLPVRLLSRYRYPTVDRLPSVKCPVLVLHSPTDDMVPVQHAQRNFAAAHEPKLFVELQGSHNDNVLAPGERFKSGLRELLDQYVK